MTDQFTFNRTHAFIVIAAAMALTLVLHLSHMSKDLVGMHVWRQAQTQNTINSFFEEDANIFKPRQNIRGGGNGIFRMEFPLMQWSIACLYHITGEQVQVTRWAMMLIYLSAITGFAFAGFHAFKSFLAAAVAAWSFCFSPEIFYYSINPLPDVLALSFCSWGIGWFFEFYNDPQKRSFAISGIFICLSALVKLPFVLFFAIPGSYLLFVQRAAFKKPTFRNYTLPFAICALPVVAWYAMVIGGWQGNGIVAGIFQSSASVEVLAGYVLHHVLSTIPELFINYACVAFYERF